MAITVQQRQAPTAQKQTCLMRRSSGSRLFLMPVVAAFDRQKWPKRHENLVEDCIAKGSALHVDEVLPYLKLSGWQHQIISRWNPPMHPSLTLVPQMGGPFRRWWFLCPRCRRRCEALYIPPGVLRDDWRCRICHGLIYAVQRYGYRHPLRRVRTYRKKMTALKTAIRQDRMRAHQMARQQQWLAQNPSNGAEVEATVRMLDQLREDLARAYAGRMARAS
jgi:hypothetical protein